jgi:DNA-binding IclR family transcriptional regulator
MSSTLRCLEVLQLLADKPYELSVTEAAKRLGIAKASAHRLLTTLVEGGFAEQDPGTNRYHVAGRALWVGTSYLRRSALYRSSFLLLQDLARRIDAPAYLGVREDNAVMFLCAAGFPSAIHNFANVGDRRPLHATSIGKALMAELPAAETDRILRETGYRWTENTIVSLADMLRELELVRQRGYATANEEWLPGHRAVAAPVRGPRGDIVAAVNVGGPADLFEEKQIGRYGRAVADTAVKISMQLGYRLESSRASFPARR